MARELNTHDGWESVINDPDRQERIDRFHAQLKAKKLNKLSGKASIFFLLTVIFSLLGITGAMINWLSAPLAFISSAFAFFYYGRFVQMRGR